MQVGLFKMSVLHAGSFVNSRESSVLVDLLFCCYYKDANRVPCSSIGNQPSITKLFSGGKYSEVARKYMLNLPGQ